MQDNNAMMLKAIGKVIHRERIRRKFKFTIFCYENDISKTTLYMVEKGKNKSYVTSLFKIIKALGLTYEEFGALLDKELPKNFMNTLD